MGVVKHCEGSEEEEIESLNQSFEGLRSEYQLLHKIGEGTFSSVYKAVDLKYDTYENKWERELCEGEYEVGENGQILRYVALKRIYVTSSTHRIHSELKLLASLSGSSVIAPIITAMRHRDQVIAVMPYFPHHDFYTIVRKSTFDDIATYIRQLFEALAFVHKKRIIHRDVKPSNFLYNVKTKQGVLVDFGLAEHERLDPDKTCVCRSQGGVKTPPEQIRTLGGYKKDDQGATRRANRAGTRGFRAPEVLFKCQSQTTKIDIWSAGVTLLSFLTKKMPFFVSKDDGEAMIEFATLFGKNKLQQCALLHGSVFETNIPSINSQGFSIERVIYCFWEEERKRQLEREALQKQHHQHSTEEEQEDEDESETPVDNDDGDENKENINEEGDKENQTQKVKFKPTVQQRAAADLVRKTLDLDFSTRYSAEQALKHKFLTEQYF